MCTSAQPPVPAAQTWLLPATVQYGFCPVSSPYLEVAASRRSAMLSGGYGFGVMYGEWPLRGMGKFEVELTMYDRRWCASRKIGVA